MPLWLLGILDRCAGITLLYALALPLRLAARVVRPAGNHERRHIFVKMKGGGSLIIALPALLGLRQKYPDAAFFLVCTQEARSYAELTGIFDGYLVIDDAALVALAITSWHAVRASFRAFVCIDLEPNSLLAAVFTLLTCARQRVGFVTPARPARHMAYTSPLAFDPAAPIHLYYDRVCQTLGAAPATTADSGVRLQSTLPPPVLARAAETTVGLAAFTSDFARQRMMPFAVWARLLARAYGRATPLFYIFGSARNRPMAQELMAALQAALPQARFVNLCGAHALAQTASLMRQCDEIWAIDSGLLHIARLLGIATRSFWGPTRPEQRLRPMPALREHVHYRAFACSPCVDVRVNPPCRGRNLCMITMADTNPDLHPPWAQKT